MTWTADGRDNLSQTEQINMKYLVQLYNLEADRINRRLMDSIKDPKDEKKKKKRRPSRKSSGSAHGTGQIGKHLEVSGTSNQKSKEKNSDLAAFTSSMDKRLQKRLREESDIKQLNDFHEKSK